MTAQVSESSRAAVVARSAGLCELDARHRGVHVHHRRPRGRGGTWRRELNEPGNLLHLCLDCHNLIEKERVWALARGLLLLDCEIPSETPVRLRHLYGEGWFLIDNDGFLSWAGEAETVRLELTVCGE